jgi:hypothetical protein
MRHLIKIIAVIFLPSCMDGTHINTIETFPENSKLETMTLKDSLGTISFSIPERFDTSFYWTNRSDCGKPCDHEQYRYQPKSFPIFMETGFYHDIPDIPIDQFTIIHSSYFPFQDGDTSRNLVRHERFKKRLSFVESNRTIRSDTIEKFGGRYFSIVYLIGFDKEKHKYFTKIAALTTIRNNEIEFHYDLTTKDTINLIGFYQNSIRHLGTVRMSNGI